MDQAEFLQLYYGLIRVYRQFTPIIELGSEATIIATGRGPLLLSLCRIRAVEYSAGCQLLKSLQPVHCTMARTLLGIVVNSLVPQSPSERVIRHHRLFHGIDIRLGLFHWIFQWIADHSYSCMILSFELKDSPQILQFLSVATNNLKLSYKESYN